MDSDLSPLSTQEIVAYVLGEADAHTCERVQNAAGTDISVARDVQLVQQMLTTLREGVFSPAPGALKKSASELLSGLKAPSLAQWLGDLIETTLAVVFDSRETPELAGFRGGSDGHHLTYSAGETEIDVLIEQEDGARVLRGQLMGTEADAVAAISSDGMVLSSAAVAADGSFSLALGPDAQDIYVKSGAGALRLRGIQ